MMLFIIRKYGPRSNGLSINGLRPSAIRCDIRRASYRNEWRTTNGGAAVGNGSNYFARCLFRNAQHFDIMLLQKQENVTEEGRGESVSTFAPARCPHGCIKPVTNKARLQFTGQNTPGNPGEHERFQPVNVADGNQERPAPQGVRTNLPVY